MPAGCPPAGPEPVSGHSSNTVTAGRTRSRRRRDQREGFMLLVAKLVIFDHFAYVKRESFALLAAPVADAP